MKSQRFTDSQQNLKKLYVDSSFNAIFERKELADTLDLKVEKLSVELLKSFDLLKFLRKQDSLERLKVYELLISHDAMQFFLNQMKSLKSLSFINVTFDDIDSLWTLEKNITIEKIHFGRNYYDNATLFHLNLLPNLKIASFIGFPKNLMEEILLAIQSNAEKLEELRFQECGIPSLELKQLKRATFENCDEDEVGEFFSINADVEEFWTMLNVSKRELKQASNTAVLFMLCNVEKQWLEKA